MLGEWRSNLAAWVFVALEKQRIPLKERRAVHQNDTQN